MLNKVLALIMLLSFAFSCAVFANAEEDAIDTGVEHTHYGDCCESEPANVEQGIEEAAGGDTVSPRNVLCDVLGHTKGTLLGMHTDATNPDINTYCYYRVTVLTYLCGRCNTQFTVSQSPVYAVHDKEYSYQGTTIRGFQCRLCGYRSWA